MCRSRSIYDHIYMSVLDAVTNTARRVVCHVSISLGIEPYMWTDKCVLLDTFSFIQLLSLFYVS
jgi:hypothetical protein